MGTTFARYTEASKGNENNLQTFWPNSTPGLTRLGFSVFHKFYASHRKPTAFVRASSWHTHEMADFLIGCIMNMWRCIQKNLSNSERTNGARISVQAFQKLTHTPTFHFNQNHLCAFSPQVFLIPFRQCEKKFHFESISCPILDTRCIVISIRPSNSIVFPLLFHSLFHHHVDHNSVPTNFNIVKFSN